MASPAIHIALVVSLAAAWAISTLRAGAADAAEVAGPPWLFEVVTVGPAVSGGVGLAAPVPSGHGASAAGLSLRWTGAVPPSGWRPGDEWRLPTPGGAAVTLRVRDLRFLADEGTLVRGELVGDPGSEVLLASHGAALTATLRPRSGAASLLQPAAGGLHRIQLQDDRFEPPRCGNVPAAGRPDRALAGLAGFEVVPGAGVTPLSVTVTQTLDIAFCHTPAAEAGAGGTEGMRSLLALALMEANDAYARSGALLQLRMVAQRRVAYSESGNLATDLDRLGRAGDGFLEEAHRIRDETAADLVCLVVESEASNALAGMANQLQGTSAELVARGFTVCVRPYLAGNYTLPHEVGHLLGCDHDRENSIGAGLNAWAYGTRITVDGVVYRTVMAYRPGRQMPHFSNPRVLFRGVPTGSADGRMAADNVRTLNSTAALVAGVREPPARVGFASATVEVSESAGVLRVTLERTGRLDAAEVGVVAVPGGGQEEPPIALLTERVTLPAGVSTATVEVGIHDNDSAGGPRRFGLLLHAPAPASVLAVGPIGVLTVVVLDDETESGTVLDSGFRSQPGADHTVTSLLVEPDGQILVGGGFATVNGERRWRLARLGVGGSVEPGFAPEVKYQVNALGRWPDGRLLLGGEFNTVDGVRLNHVAVLEADGRPAAGFEFDLGTDYPVRAVLPLAGGRMLIGGGFTSVQGRFLPRVARLLPTGQPDASFAPGQGPDGEVLALALDGLERVVIGGRFGAVSGQPRPGVARLTAGGGLDAGFVVPGTADGPVRALSVDPLGRIVLAGEFTRLAGRAAGRVARLLADGSPDSAFDSGTGADGPILTLALAGDVAIWIGGSFTRVDGVPRKRVARLLPDGGLDTSFEPGVGPNDTVLVVSPRTGGPTYIGGLFTEVNGVARGGVAALLPAAPVPARFVEFRLEGDRVRWGAVAEPRQVYRLEESVDLQTWTSSETGVADLAGGVAGARNRSVTGAEYFRLRRQVE